jgi:carbon monoxide dehydrogenase subunit G
MLHFEGDTDFPQPTSLVWSKLSDIRFLASCIPDVESITHNPDNSATCIVRPGFSFVRGTLEVTTRITEAVEGQPLRIHADGKGIGSSNELELSLQFTDKDAGTRIHWSCDVTKLGGLLKAMPQGLLKGAAQKVIGDVWEQVRKKLG